jgi:hypothetical protein
MLPTSFLKASHRLGRRLTNDITSWLTPSKKCVGVGSVVGGIERAMTPIAGDGAKQNPHHRVEISIMAG